MAAAARVIDIHVVADSTGDTGTRVARATQAQFPGQQVRVVRHPRLHSPQGVDDVVDQLRADPAAAVVFCTVVDDALRTRVLDGCAALDVPCADLLAPALDAFTARTGAQPARVVQPVGLAADYFDRIHAMEFAVANDDGHLTDGLDEAQVVLVGASRTGKTPLSMYLGYLGYPTANIPLVPGVAPPRELFEAERWKVVGLTIDPERLLEIRQRRVHAMGAAGLGRQRGTALGGYADLARIHDELDEVARLQRRLGCPVLDTTTLALEEAAGRVVELVTARRRALAPGGADRSPGDDLARATPKTRPADRRRAGPRAATAADHEEQP
ncbi:pyruvate, water dikinase regulatory protein [Cellulosimicrobium cellulans]|uniref:pyruvate, water dikinase regulatory protein n=1 Tax=Cellulosimicrobium cellulans TaxID=1710 RepID=UPI0024057AAC|nr:pyruvate, water dikinase regulatory protein [Cellulosimicrobium cellulans]MDF9877400.1 regulator of PEP synthase PpsR (kinase-PPPase family) [Cellulosimicrobium cellulans]